MAARPAPYSPAVMARRREPRDSLDDFPTPPWAARALVVHALQMLRRVSNVRTALEPACGRGHMMSALREYIPTVHGFDIHDYGVGLDTGDFLDPVIRLSGYHLIATNPPFRLAVPFAEKALRSAPMVALLVRTAWTESLERYTLFRDRPPALIAQFAERVPMVKGRLDRKASTATAYCWVVWAEGQTDTRWRHIPPCRRELERPGDYHDLVIATGGEAIQPRSPRGRGAEVIVTLPESLAHEKGLI